MSPVEPQPNPGTSAGPFDLSGPLPDRDTVLEASAGTGKTYTIAALAARYVADGIPLKQLLLVTFTRLATGELRDRVRERLTDCERALSAALSSGDGNARSRGSDDPVIELLLTGERRELELRRDRLTAAVTDFDAATIETTHSFCQRMLAELGTLGDFDPDVQFVDQVDGLLGEVVDDLYIQLFSKPRSVEPIGVEQALKLATSRVGDPTALLYPLDPEARSAPALRRWLAQRALAELEKRKREAHVMTHNDQLTRLLTILTGPNGDRAAARLRERFAVVLIDEFQDTDPVQWGILRRAFGPGDTRLILIGDPKQAIYSFRGADVYTYLAAARQAGERATLLRNHRSDKPLLDAINALFGNARLGHSEIPYRPLSAGPGNLRSRIGGPTDPAPLRLRVIDGDAPIARTGSGIYFDTAATREFVAADVAADIARQLSSGITLELDVVDADVVHAERETAAPNGRESARPTRTRPLAPGDIAVLVREHRQADAVHSALLDCGVPAVISGGGSVFATPAAEDWQALLGALERPTDRSRAARAALSSFIAWDGERLALADDDQIQSLHLRLHQWARILRDEGIATLSATIIHSEQLPARLLAGSGGDRRLTDIQHIAELLHQRAKQEQLGVGALAAWLRERVLTASAGRAGDELTRRLDTDAAAVHVLTIHAAKGLEFPVVYCPYLWGGRKYEAPTEPIYFHPEESSELRALDVALAGEEFKAHARLHLDEARGEDLRLAYVALTRARHQVVLWWTGGPYFAFDSPLGRLLFARDHEGNISAKAPSPRPTEHRVTERMKSLSAEGKGTITIELSRIASTQAPAARSDPEFELTRAGFDRHLDRDWQRTSYSALTAAAHTLATSSATTLVSSEPDIDAITDDERGGPSHSVTEVHVGEPEPRPADTGVHQPRPTSPPTLPLAAMSAGAALGTVVHRALELVEFDAPDLDSALAQALLDANLAVEEVLGCAVSVAARGLGLALRTPLGGILGSLTLAGISRQDRLDELRFELPLAGGERPDGNLCLARIADALAAGLPPDDPIDGYPQLLRTLDSDRPLRGFLNGTIDLVTRAVDRQTGQPRFHVIDYKTNWLAVPGDTLSIEHYRPAALAAEMQRSHYVLQGLLYCVALHRYLRWRLTSYDPALHLGSIHYLFLRGMTAPSAPGQTGDSTPARPGKSTPGEPTPPSGVFAWQPPADLIVKLSAVIDGL